MAAISARASISFSIGITSFARLYRATEVRPSLDYVLSIAYVDTYVNT